LVAVLFVYAAGGTLISAKLGQPLVGLNFQQEALEADFRYGLVGRSRLHPFSRCVGKCIIC
jgi:ABC-type uncharacterized transport system fused permease/ATPase subunit